MSSSSSSPSASEIRKVEGILRSEKRQPLETHQATVQELKLRFASAMS